MSDTALATALQYIPSGPVLARFLDDLSFVSGIMGPYGSGKSTGCVMRILRHAIEQRRGPDGVRRSRWAIIRNTYPELRTTTMKTWWTWMPQTFGKWIDQGPPTHTIEFARGDDGSTVHLEVLFLALDQPDDVRKLLSLELTGVWINEAREVLKAVLDACTGRVGRYPSAAMGGSAWSGIIMDTNPPDTDHWWYAIAENDASTETGRQYIETTREAEREMRKAGLLAADKPLFSFHRQPGGRDPNAENLANLEPGYYIRQIAGKTADWISVYIDGNYGFVQDGKAIFPEYNDGVHCATVEPSRMLPFVIGMDFGLTPAAAFIQKDFYGRWLVFDEIAAVDMGAVRFGQRLHAHIQQHYPDMKLDGVWGDPAGDQRAQTDESTPFQMLRAQGIHARPVFTNDFTVRREAVAQPLSRLIDGKPGLIVHPRCTVIRKGLMGAYRYRRLQIAGRDQYHDKPDKGPHSHACEALQYALVGGGEGKAVLRSVRPGRSRQQRAIADEHDLPRGGRYANS